MKYIVKNINDISNKELESFELLNSDILKLKKLLLEKRKKQFIVGRMLLDKLLNENYNIKYIDMEIIYNENGKPYFSKKSIYFNISHSEDYVIVVISDKEIGVDIEKIKNISLSTIKLFSNKNEIDYIVKDKKFLCFRAFQIYTLKEAYIKKYGKNLSELLNINFSIKNDKVESFDDLVSINIIYNIDNYVISIVSTK